MADSTHSPNQVLEATESFVCELDGERFFVQARTTRIAADHKLAKAHPRYFRPVESGLAYAEDATMANEPGRSDGRSRTTRAKAPAIAER